MKLNRGPSSGQIVESPPVRGRGLKLGCHDFVIINRTVAPRAGAWIETWPYWTPLFLQPGRPPCGGVD